MPADSPDVSVRMYKSGLGDCFLLTFRGKDGPVHMMVDCGVIVGTADGKATMQTVVGDIKEATGGKLDVIVATHEHWDHISGFAQAKNVFDEMKVGHVWLAWTEEPGNQKAKELKEEFAFQLKLVQDAVTRWEAAGVQPRLYHGITEVVSFFGEVLSAGPTTQDALRFLTSREDADYKYLTPGQKPFAIPGVEGIRVYVLGPPSDPNSIRKLLPRAHSDDAYEIRMTPALAFHAAVSGSGSDEDRLALPFDDYYMIPKAEALSRQDDVFFQFHYGQGFNPYDDWRRIDEDWLTVAGQLALDLDNRTNNTCLALAFEIVATGEVLLFPGDAQIGNWESWKSVKFSVPDGNGGSKQVQSKDLLERTVFYKVGHHGSHNATHRAEGLELMTSRDLIAMIPVNQEMAKKKKWNMPFPPLYKRLNEKCRSRVIRQDVPLDDTLAEAEKTLTKSELAAFRKRVRETGLYVECDFPG